MQFGRIAVRSALGAILAHSIEVSHGRLRKGRRLNSADIESLLSSGYSEVTAARLEPSDIDENEAADRIATALADGQFSLQANAAFTGRANILADRYGLLEVDSDRVFALNEIDPAITLATRPHLSRTIPRQMVATVKIVTYGVAEKCVIAAESLCRDVLRHHAVRYRTVGLLLTQMPGMPIASLSKGRSVVEARLNAFGLELIDCRMTPHSETNLASAIKQCEGDILLILVASATSDEGDVGPVALGLAGGKLVRFGMPVDPGNLLFLGKLGDRPVVGLPGCAKSPALNGADWVLERLACGIDVSASDISSMGAGGLLKEIPSRPQPRSVPRPAASPPNITAAILGDGDAATEILSLGKLPNVRLLPHRPGSDCRPLAMARAAIQNLRRSDDALLLVAAGGSMQSPDRLQRLIGAFSIDAGRELCCFVDHELPVLLGRRFFETAFDLADDAELSSLAAAAPEHVFELDDRDSRKP